MPSSEIFEKIKEVIEKENKKDFLGVRR